MAALFELYRGDEVPQNPDRNNKETALEAGAWLSFEGRVRRHNEGREVLSLEYSAYPELAKKEGQRIVEEALSRFLLRSAQARHRVGTLGVGDLALWVEVGAGHRDEAFAACRWIVDQIKERVPIWKKEEYLEGDRAWVSYSQESPRPV